ncbi:MAG: type I-MYXAN CRISPR-associated protein Cas6/Cmx6 [Planctomycetes bacterium]|nr:type I-MYXAN CRISPR-associated protein Cas6/Cmx6 [Planctomycetota bacterium]
MSHIIDLGFPLAGAAPVPADHGYALHGAISRLLPDVHREKGLAVHPIAGRQFGDRLLSLQPWSRLTLRTHADQIPALLPLAGKQLSMAGTMLRIGVPQVHALQPATALRSRLVTIKGFLDAAPFEEALRRQLDALKIPQDAKITLGRRRTLRIKDKEVVGHEVFLEGLTAEESLSLQEQGAGGRRHMGCGVFTPFQVREAQS